MLKRTLTALVLSATLAAPASAQLTDEGCALMGDLAEITMQNRQAGIAMSRQRAALVGDAEEPYRTVILAVLTLAYDVPRYTTPEYQRRAAEDFRNRVEAECYRSSQ